MLQNYYPNNTGSSTVMTNLIKELNQDSIYGVVTCANNFNDPDEKQLMVKLYIKYLDFNFIHSKTLVFYPSFTF